MSARAVWDDGRVDRDSQGLLLDQNGAAHNPYNSDTDFPGPLEGQDFDEFVESVRARVR